MTTDQENAVEAKPRWTAERIAETASESTFHVFVEPRLDCACGYGPPHKDPTPMATITVRRGDEAKVAKMAAALQMEGALDRIQRRAAAQPVHVCSVADFDFETIARDASAALEASKRLQP